MSGPSAISPNGSHSVTSVQQQSPGNDESQLDGRKIKLQQTPSKLKNWINSLKESFQHSDKSQKKRPVLSLTSNQRSAWMDLATRKSGPPKSSLEYQQLKERMDDAEKIHKIIVKKDKALANSLIAQFIQGGYSTTLFIEQILQKPEFQSCQKALSAFIKYDSTLTTSLNSFITAAKFGDRVVIQDGPDGTPQIVAVKNSHKDRIFINLLKLPGIKNLNALQTFKKQQEIENSKAHGLFLRALQQEYAVKPAIETAFNTLHSEMSSFIQTVIPPYSTQPEAKKILEKNEQLLSEKLVDIDKKVEIDEEEIRALKFQLTKIRLNFNNRAKFDHDFDDETETQEKDRQTDQINEKITNLTHTISSNKDDLKSIKDQLNQIRSTQAALNDTYKHLDQIVAQHYEDNPVMATLEQHDGAPQLPLNSQRISRLHTIAKNFHGSGDAKPYDRHIVVRVWPYKSLSHIGHASVGIKGKSYDGKLYKTNMGWWNNLRPSEQQPKKKFFYPLAKFLNTLLPENKMIEGFYSASIYLQKDTVNSYSEEKSSSIPDTTRDKLEAGYLARSILNSGKLPEDSTFMALFKAVKDIPGLKAARLTALDNMLKKISENKDNKMTLKQKLEKIAKYTPYSRQKRFIESTDTASWEISAEKVYIPLAGKNYNKRTKSESFNIFGLNEQGIQEHWKKMQDDPKTQYQLFDQNCSSTTIDLLKAGGAELYHKAKTPVITEDPNMAKQYALKLQYIVDTLNKKTGTLFSLYENALKKSDYNTVAGQPINGMGPSELEKQFSYLLDQLPSEQRKPFNALAKEIKQLNTLAEQEESKLTHNTLIPTAKNLVEMLSSLCENNRIYNQEGTQEAQLLTIGIAALKHIEEIMKNSNQNQL